MATVNISKVHLLNVPLENDYKHSLYFNGVDNQTSYFLSKKVKTFDNVSYQRKDFKIRIPEHIDKLYICNYVMYQNSYYSNKWFYAFIKNMEYINNEVTELTIETDVLQTWYFDYQIKPSFVEREHVKDDSVGKHTQPEQLETGSYIVNKVNRLSALNDCVIIMASTIDPSIDSSGKLIGGNTYGGVYGRVQTGYKYYSFLPNSEKLPNVLKAFADAGKNDAIGMLFIAPKKFIPTPSDGEYDDYMIPDSYIAHYFKWSEEEGSGITKLNSLNGYVPRNKKLLTYPYCYMNMTNNNGANAIFKYELFSGDTCDFEIYGVLTPGMDIILTPQYYNGVLNGSNFIESLSCGKYPICGWASDVYINWLTQNGVNIATSLASSGIQIVGGLGIAASGGGALMGASSITSGSIGIAQTIGEIYKHSLTPMQAEGNVNTGNVKYASSNGTFTAYGMSIKSEYAQVIDDYFDMFGYKVNTVKIPNKAHRSRYWYTKTIDINIDGSLPMNDLQKIKDIYNNGVTFWRNASEIQDYSLSNGIAIID